MPIRRMASPFPHSSREPYVACEYGASPYIFNTFLILASLFVSIEESVGGPMPRTAAGNKNFSPTGDTEGGTSRRRLRLLNLPRPAPSCRPLGRRRRVKAREAILQRLGLDAVALVKIMGSEEDAPPAWKAATRRAAACICPGDQRWLLSARDTALRNVPTVSGLAFPWFSQMSSHGSSARQAPAGPPVAR